ncbi:hypothetical protein [Roseibium algae]|uniref:HTH cro/C1-type domain-containing protein n=1 Tax=Roseibium algae TaxID=3123038 RepID=A0ABU8TQ21_9HYPH
MAYIACAPTSSDGAINELLQGWGRDIAAARQSMGLSQPACANCLFLSVETVVGIENGDARIGLGAFVTVLWALGLVENLDGPLAPVEIEERPVFLPVVVPAWQVSGVPVPYQPSELWPTAEADASALGSLPKQHLGPADFLFEQDDSQNSALAEKGVASGGGALGAENPALVPQFRSWALASEKYEIEFLRVAVSANQVAADVKQMGETADIELDGNPKSTASSIPKVRNQGIWKTIGKILRRGREYVLRQSE